MLKGREFTIFTNHKPLTHALFRMSTLWSARQQRHLSYLAEFTSSMVHAPGPKNFVADTLFRPSPAPAPSASALVSLSSPFPLPPEPADPVFSKFDIFLLPPLQLTCSSFAKMQSSPPLSVVSVPVGDNILLCYSSAGSFHPLVPVQFCCQLFDLLHAASHPGVR